MRDSRVLYEVNDVDIDEEEEDVEEEGWCKVKERLLSLRELLALAVRGGVEDPLSEDEEEDEEEEVEDLLNASARLEEVFTAAAAAAAVAVALAAWFRWDWE